jgi:lysozyme
MNRAYLADLIKKHEGFKERPYKCPAGKTTIGYGFNLDASGLPVEVADFWLTLLVEEVLADLNKMFVEYFLFPESVQLAFADMRYNLGHDGFLKFKNMIAYAKEWKWHNVADAMVDSKWYEQVGDRAKDLVTMVKAVA